MKLRIDATSEFEELTQPLPYAEFLNRIRRPLQDTSPRLDPGPLRLVDLVVALGVTRVIRSLLVGVPANDPLTFVVTPGLLVASALVASYVPASRAARLDPTVTLRED